MKQYKPWQFKPKYNDDDMAKFVRWIQAKRDFNECMADIVYQYKVNPMTAYRWMHKAAKLAH